MAKTAPLADSEQRRRAASDLDTCYLVEAAAGTGKTTLLVERVMSIVRQRKARLSQVAAITFTEKAAGELKIKLREELEKALPTADSNEQALWSEALADLDLMPVGTIHGFCADLIRERPVEARVEPGFDVADELAADLIFEATWQDFLAERMSGDNPALRVAIEAGVSLQRKGEYGSTLSDLMRILCDNRDLLDSVALQPGWPEDRFRETARQIRQSIDDLAAMEQSCKTEEDGGAQQIARLVEWAASLNSEDAGAIAAWLLAEDSKVSTTAGNQGNWEPKGALGAVKAEFRRLKEIIEGAASEASHRLIAALLEELHPLIDRYAAAKDERASLDFADLLLVARGMLATSRPARSYFKGKFKFILVDEFQDTDPIQAEIVFFLCERDGQHAAEWDQVQLVPGKLFIVGDPKQSIYGFRRADLDLYGRVRTLISSQGRALDISVNFRTLPAIIDEVNALCGPLMTGPVGGRFEPAYAPMVPYRQASSENPAVLFLPPPPGLAPSALKADECRAKESGAITAFVAELVKKGREVFDKRAGKNRPVTFSDVAILYRSATGLDALEDALSANDIPYQVAGGRSYYARLETQHLLGVLLAIENPHDAASVVAALRSPFFGCSDEELFLHVSAAGSFTYLHAAASGQLKEGFDVLAELHHERTGIGHAALIERLFERTQVLPLYAMKPHGEQRVANLLKSLDLARSFEAAEGGSFRAFVHWLASQEETGRAEEESPVAEQGDNFVQLMTFHKAKGLEFPVVILAHLGFGKRGKRALVLDRTTAALEISLSVSLRTRGWDEANETQASREEHEERRLLYVALTRARDLLVMPAYWAQKDDNGFLRYLKGQHPPDENGLPTVFGDGVELIDTAGYDLDRRPREAFRFRLDPDKEPSRQAKALLKQRQQWAEQVAERVRVANAARAVLTATEAVKLTEVEAERTGAIRVSGGAALGSLVHRVLEIVDLREPGNLDSLATAEAQRRGLSERQATDCAAMIRRTLTSPFFTERVLRSRQIYREVPFAVEHNGVLCEGIIDLIFLEDKQAVVVDFKTDRVEAAELEDKVKTYRPQAALYALAMQSALSAPVSEVIFFFTPPCLAAPVPVDARLLQEAETILLRGPSHIQP